MVSWLVPCRSAQVAVEEAQKSTSPITMARVVLQLSPSRRIQLMNILVQENVLEDASALRSVALGGNDVFNMTDPVVSFGWGIIMN